MTTIEVLRAAALSAVILAAAAVVALSVRGYLLAQRVHRLAEQISQVVEQEVKQALAQVEEAARGMRDTAEHVDHALAPLSRTVHRIERWTAALAAEALVASAVSPAVAKIGGWLSGLRKLLGEALRHREGGERG